MTENNEELIQNFKHDWLRVFLADIVSKSTSKALLDDRIAELENLVETYGWLVILKKYQKRDAPDLKTYVWKWKLEEIIADMQAVDANLLIIWNVLKPRQLYEISEQVRPLGIKVRDRVDLILKIFGKHAQSMEARLQIELAAIKHMWPRIFWMWLELSRQWGWIWTKWIWETNTERMKRHLKEKLYKINKKLEQYSNMRDQHRKSRQKKRFPVVWIVWYTNAWKSSLLNAVTKKNVLVADKLFATLWTSVWKMFVFTDITKWIWKEILLSDTIWFIRELPPQLIQAFSSTLEDSIESDILLHVINAADPFLEERIAVVEEILSELWADQPKLMVFNKIDLLDQEKLKKLKQEYSKLNPVWISVKDNIWLENLKQEVVKYLK